MFCDIKEELSNPSILQIIAYSEFEESLECADKRAQEYRNDASQYFYGWIESGEILGTCAFHIYSDKTVIDGIAVAKNARRRGIGGAMVSMLQQKCNTIIEAETDDDAVGFYRKRGFIISEAPKKKDYCRWLCTLPVPATPLFQKCSNITLPELSGQIIAERGL